MLMKETSFKALLLSRSKSKTHLSDLPAHTHPRVRVYKQTCTTHAFTHKQNAYRLHVNYLSFSSVGCSSGSLPDCVKVKYVTWVS